MNDNIVQPGRQPQGCDFCGIASGRILTPLLEEWEDAVAIRPRNPVTPGHLLVIPALHVERAGVDPDVTGRMFAYADWLAAEQGRLHGYSDYNLIVNGGPEAGMTVPHLHIHIVPRRAGDGLPLPWTPQQIVARNQVGGA